MAAGGALVGDAVFVELGGQILHLVDACVDNHMDVIAAALKNIYDRRESITHGFRITWEAPLMRHFTVKLEPFLLSVQIGIFFARSFRALSALFVLP